MFFMRCLLFPLCWNASFLSISSPFCDILFRCQNLSFCYGSDLMLLRQFCIHTEFPLRVSTPAFARIFLVPSLSFYPLISCFSSISLFQRYFFVALCYSLCSSCVMRILVSLLAVVDENTGTAVIQTTFWSIFLLVTAAAASSAKDCRDTSMSLFCLWMAVSLEDT